MTDDKLSQHRGCPEIYSGVARLGLLNLWGQNEVGY